MDKKCTSCPARANSFCRVVPTRHLKAFAKKRSLAYFDSRQTIVCEGGPAVSFFNVVSGVVKLSRSLSDGRTNIVGFRLPGELFGTSERATYTSSAEAITGVELCVFSLDWLKRGLREYPQLLPRLLALSFRQLASAEDQILLLGQMKAREKVAHFLQLYARRPFCDKGERQNGAELPMNRAEIAGYLGLTIETVSRVLSDLKRNDIITIGRASHSINVINMDALERVAGIRNPALVRGKMDQSVETT